MNIKRLSLEELETWKRKAAACDEALAYLKGRVQSEECMRVELILRRALDPEATL